MSKNDISDRMMRNNGKISKLLRLSICLMLMVCAGSQLRAQAGSLDLAFNPGTGANGDVHAVAIQPDGKILIGGTFTQYAGTARNRIARLNTDGTLDLTFNPGTGCNGTVYAIAIQSDGKIVLGGAFTTYSGSPRNGMARLNANGSIDTGFTIGSGFGNGRVASISIQPNGFFVVGGTFTTFDGVGRNRILRLNASGGLDTSFNPGSGANNNVSATAIQTDGKILIGGIFIAFNGVNRNRIARLNANGTLDTGFANGNGFDDGVLCIRIQSDGKIVAGGLFTNYVGTARSRMARLTTTGALDATFNPGSGFNTTVHAISIQGDGKFVVGGAFTLFNGVARNRIVRLNANGTLDASFGPGTGFNSGVNAVALQSDGKTVAGGTFTLFNGTGRNRIARLLYRAECDMVTCVGRGLTFTPAAINGLAYAWNFGDNSSSSQQAPTHTYGIAGTYTVNLQLTDANGCISTQSQKVCVFPKVVLSAISMNPSCNTVNNGMIDLTVSGGAPGTTFTYQWSSGQTTQDISGLGAGTYTVTVTDMETGCSQTLSTTLTAPIPPKYGIAGQSGFCQGGSVTLDAGLGYSNYLWSTGATTQTITVSAAGTYSVTVTTLAGCQSTASKTVVMYPLPAVAINYSPLGCTGVNGTLATTPSFVSYAWSTGPTTPTINVTQKGPYSVTVTDANGCTNSATIQVNPSSSCPTPGGLPVTANNNSSATLNWIAVPCAVGYTIQYRKVGTIPPGTTVTVAAPATSVTITGLTAGTQYQWRINTDCGQGPASAWSVYYQFSTPFAKAAAVSAEASAPEPTLFPNPNDGKFTVKYDAAEMGEVEVCVWDMNGKRVYCEKKSTNEGENTWDMDFQLASGVYFFRIEPLTQGMSEPKRIKFVVE
ncbi:MAG: T9SS type A sorting domain-containing protein [Bacteroidetes bacterium]|nr:T9SS type A sorting domain-containing protein [Bacteroidota bacterium]